MFYQSKEQIKTIISNSYLFQVQNKFLSTSILPLIFKNYNTSIVKSASISQKHKNSNLIQ